MAVPISLRCVSIRVRTASCVIRLAVFVSAALGLLLSAEAQSDKAGLTVEYTGRLFGYYRIEAVEKGPDGTQLPRLQAVTKFLSRRSPSAPLLLGMGDNFAPEFGSAIQQEFKSAAGVLAPCRLPQIRLPKDSKDIKERKYFAPESLYKAEDRRPAMADCDNVTRFLMTAGYRAIVPGREDFIYSGTWLRRIAVLMKGASAASDEEPNPFLPKDYAEKTRWKAGQIESTDGKLHMLAANLRVQASGPNSKGDKACPLLFADNLYWKDHACAEGTDFITEEMGWLRRLDQSTTSASVEESLGRQAVAGSEFRTQLLVNQASIVDTILRGNHCVPPTQLSALLKAAVSTKAQELKTEVAAGSALRGFASAPECPGIVSLYSYPSASKNGSVAAQKILGDIGSLTKVFGDILDPEGSSKTKERVPGPLLPREERQDAARLLLLLIAQEQKDAGYTIARYAAGKNALVIGVVGTETMQEVTPAYFQVIPDLNDKKTPSAAADIPTAEEGNSAVLPLKVADPVFAVTTVLRAASAAHDAGLPGSQFDTVIVMAQMPHAESYELGVHVRNQIESLYRDEDGYPDPNRPLIDLILSEAQQEHQSPNTTFAVNLGEDTPVLTPADSAAPDPERETDPVSRVTLSLSASSQGRKRPPDITVENRLPVSTPVSGSDGKAVKLAGRQLDAYSAAPLLYAELQSLGNSSFLSSYKTLWNGCPLYSACRDSVLIQILLRSLQRSSNSDVVLLKRRDFFFGWLGPEYAGYNVCEQWARENNYSEEGPSPDAAPGSSFPFRYCQLHTALDRVLWKGDYSERIMIDGATLTGLMKTAKSQTDQEQTLLARDLHQEWLMTYGIVTAPPTNLAAAASGPDSFSVPGVDGCNASPGSLFGKEAAGGASDPTYCINGQSVSLDRAYWLATSNQLADDVTVYTALGAWTKKNPHYTEITNRDGSSNVFITTKIADDVSRSLQPSRVSLVPHVATKSGLAMVENEQQARSLIQLDYTKLVGGYSVTSPDLPDATLSTDFAGVSNTQASTPHSQELDLEAASRLLYAPWLSLLTLGVQSDAEYDRKYSGNLTGSPETVTYAANSYTVGGFAQIYLPFPWRKEHWADTIDRSTRNLVRAFLVVAPYQYQRQLAPNYIAFPYYLPSASGGTFSKAQFFNLQLPIPAGFSQRLGFRLEMSGIPKWSPDPGSYVEAGPEYAVQNNVLAAVRVNGLPPSAPFPSCPATAIAFMSSPTAAPTSGNPLVNCVKYDYQTENLPLNASANLSPVPETLHAGGIYWYAHFQKNLDAKKTYSFSFDTSGDSFLRPGFTLTTQTRYAFNTKLALNLRILPNLANLTLSPTYSNFYFENQGDNGSTLHRTGLIATTFSISAKWYFARDAGVPFRKQLWFLGPASVDQTNSAKTK